MILTRGLSTGYFTHSLLKRIHIYQRFECSFVTTNPVLYDCYLGQATEIRSLITESYKLKTNIIIL